MWTQKNGAISLAAIFFLLVAPVTAIGSEEKETVIFLVGKVCERQLKLQEAMPNYLVGCSNERIWQLAQARLWGFEEWFYVIYVNDSGINGHLGQSFGKFAVAIDAPFVIEHEREHLVCQCFYTPDGLHGSPETGAKN